MFKNAFRQIWQSQEPSDVIEYSEKKEDETRASPALLGRIHPVTTAVSPNALSGSKSPGTGRAIQGDIPFVIPPLRNSKIKIKVTPSNQMPHQERSSIESRGDLSLSEGDDSSTHSENSSIGTSVSRRENQAEFATNPALTSNNGALQNDHNSNGLGTIRPELYKYTECKDADLHQSRCGRVWFSMVYDGAVESLAVKVIKVKQLLPRERANTPRDSFVKLFLLPNERLSQQTKVRFQTNNPLFNETFTFQVSCSELQRRSLRFSVYDTEKRKSARHLLGHALVSLKDFDQSKANEVVWRDLDDIAHPGDTGSSLGDLNIAMTYFPKLNRLVVVITEAKNLRNMDLESTEIHVRIELIQGHKVIKTKKTTTMEGVPDPEFNESFSFKVVAKDMAQTNLSINVITTSKQGTFQRMTSSFKNSVTRANNGRTHKYGKVCIGSYLHCRGSHLLHWQEMMAQPGKSIAKWHALSTDIVSP